MEANTSTNADSNVAKQPQAGNISAIAASIPDPPAYAVGNDYLIPVRVDVSSDDKSVRIVETLLMDPTCWPIPLTPPLHESVNQNVREIAHTLLSDLEVQGMGRTVRHFTGRVDLWTLSLQRKIEDQLRPQFWQIAASNNSIVNVQKSSSQPNNKGAGGRRKKDSIIPIKIRLTVNDVIIKEDIMWDPLVPDYTPLDFAQTLGEELNLPDEAVIAVATTIVEQLHGITMEESEERPIPSISNPGIGATDIESKDHMSNMSIIVSQHRPT